MFKCEMWRHRWVHVFSLTSKHDMYMQEIRAHTHTSAHATFSSLNWGHGHLQRVVRHMIWVLSLLGGRHTCHTHNNNNNNNKRLLTVVVGQLLFFGDPRFSRFRCFSCVRTSEAALPISVSILCVFKCACVYVRTKSVINNCKSFYTVDSSTVVAFRTCTHKGKQTGS